MTRDEIEAQLRELNPTCRGARIETITLEQYEAFPEPLQDALGAAGAKGTTSLCIGTLLEAGFRQEAAALDAIMRVSCGRSQLDVVLAEPFDGKHHEQPCPNCGALIEWTPAKPSAE